MSIGTVWKEDKEAEYKVCETCKHFFQHYVKTDPYGKSYIKTFAGHCPYPQMKDRLADTKACKNYKKDVFWKLKQMM